MEKKILMTGATGNIGSVLLPRLLAHGWTILCIGRRRRPLQHERLCWPELDLSSAIPEGLTSGISLVLHLANLSKTDPDADLRAAQNLAQVALQSGVETFFYAS